MNNIYRQIALSKLASPDRLDTMLYVVSSRAWLTLVVIGVFILSGIFWSIFATLPVTVDGFGILTRAGDKIQVSAAQKGIIQSVLVDVGDEVSKDQPLLVLDNKSQIVAPLTGRILTITAKAGDTVDANTPVVTEESTDDAANPLQAILYVNAIDGQAIEPGLPVLLSPATVRTSETGFLRGQVISVQQSPVSSERISQIVGSSELANNVATGESLLEVHVGLVADATTPSGYAWSSAKGSPFKLYSGTEIDATITTGQRHPINLIFAN